MLRSRAGVDKILKYGSWYIEAFLLQFQDHYLDQQYEFTIEVR